MKSKTAVGAALIGVLIGLSTAQAGGSIDQNSRAEPLKTAYEMEYGKALPPIGFVQFCARLPKDDNCQSDNGRHNALVMTPERWNLIDKVNSYVNAKIAPMSDQDQYGVPEYWAYPVDAGDCEDYVLLKQRYLIELGFPIESLLITVVLDEKKEGHAVLTVTTAQGDYVLDNRRDDVLRWSDTAYTYLKRQSPRDPRLWASLTTERPAISGFVAGGPGGK